MSPFSLGDRIGLVLTQTKLHGHGLLIGEATMDICFKLIVKWEKKQLQVDVRVKTNTSGCGNSKKLLDTIKFIFRNIYRVHKPLFFFCIICMNTISKKLINFIYLLNIHV